MGSVSIVLWEYTICHKPILLKRRFPLQMSIHPNYDDLGFEGCLSDLGDIGRFATWPINRQYSIRFNKNKVPSVVGLRYLYKWSVQQDPVNPKPIPLILCLGERKHDTDYRYYDTRPYFFVTSAERVMPNMTNDNIVIFDDVTKIDMIGMDNAPTCFMVDRLSRLYHHEEYVIEFLYSTGKPFNFFTSTTDYNDNYAGKDIEDFELPVADVLSNPEKIQTVFLRVYNKYL